MGHGPDADDAFVFEPLIHDRVDRDGLRFVHHHLPFDRLNARAAGDDPFDVTMLSVAALARLTGRFLALPFGGSFVRTMGPTLVAPERLPLRAFARGTVAVPGTETTAALLLRFALPRVRTVVLPYDEIAAAVAAGRADAGVVIHEGQIDFTRHGLVAVSDLGVRWMRRNALPTPLAVCAIRADLPRARRDRIVRVLERSLAAARAEPAAALAYAEQFTGGLGPDAAARLIEEYVSDDTYALTARGREAVRTLVAQAQALDAPPALTFAGAA